MNISCCNKRASGVAAKFGEDWIESASSRIIRKSLYFQIESAVKNLCELFHTPTGKYHITISGKLPAFTKEFSTKQCARYERVCTSAECNNSGIIFPQRIP